MSGPFSGGSGSSGPFTAAKPSSSTSSSVAHGVGGFVEHLIGDVADTAKGLPTGIVHIFKTNPVVTAEEIGKATWADWSPLFHGHPGEWAHNFYAHPLGPLLDVSAFVTDGASLAGRAARAIDSVGLASEGGKIARLAEYSRPGATLKFDKVDSRGTPYKTMEKPLSSNPATRFRQEKLSHLADVLGNYVPSVLGRDARYDRMASRSVQARHAALGSWMATIVNAGKKLSGPDKMKYEEDSLTNMHRTMAQFAYKHDITKAIPEGFVAVRNALLNSRGVIGRRLNRTFEQELIGARTRFTLKPHSKTGMLSPAQLGHAAKVDAGRNILIVPRHTAKALGIEGANSARAVKLLYTNPTLAWKMLQLGGSPRFFVNNYVGNHWMYAMAHDPVNGFRGYMDALRQAYGKHEHIVAKSLQQAVDKRDGNVLDKWFRDQLGNTLANSTLHELGKQQKLMRKASRFTLFGVTHAAADQFLRRATLNAYLRKDKGVRAAMKSGKSFEDSVDHVLSKDAKDANGRLRGIIGEHVMNVMGDYHTLSPLERTVRNIIPFYAWDRHIARHMARMIGERPGRVLAMQKVGAQGAAENKQLMGDVPSFLQGALPLSMLGLHKDHPSRKAVLMTSGLNPYSTIGDIGNAIGSAVGGSPQNAAESLGSEMNPLLQAMVEHLSGHSLLTDAPVKQPSVLGMKMPLGPLGAIEAEPFVNTAIPQMVERALSPRAQPKNPNQPFLYEKTPQETLLSWLGLPVKQYSPSAAARLAKAEKKRK